jgi:hypothetical protein
MKKIYQKDEKDINDIRENCIILAKQITYLSAIERALRLPKDMSKILSIMETDIKCEKLLSLYHNFSPFKTSPVNSGKTPIEILFDKRDEFIKNNLLYLFLYENITLDKTTISHKDKQLTTDVRKKIKSELLHMFNEKIMFFCKNCVYEEHFEIDNKSELIKEYICDLDTEYIDKNIDSADMEKIFYILINDFINYNYSFFTNNSFEFVKKEIDLIRNIINSAFPQSKYEECFFSDPKEKFIKGELLISYMDPMYHSEINELKNFSKIKLYVKDSTLYSDDIIFDTMDSSFIFVLDEDCCIYAAKREIDNDINNHSYLVLSDFGFGNRVAMSGYISCIEGRIGSILCRSGHYKPNQDQAILAVKYLGKTHSFSIFCPDFYLESLDGNKISLNEILQTDSSYILKKYLQIEEYENKCKDTYNEKFGNSQYYQIEDAVMKIFLHKVDKIIIPNILDDFLLELVSSTEYMSLAMGKLEELKIENNDCL